ncbi:GPR1/FUN34/YaaH-class plasma membrane protein [Pseudovirgaria hyperparasitica]|uniref:GPR1/FUN34/YaaH-class plasma membrane protein n=1 Tax=Pseudovirgaria hyperparasitica TaxID=470096 RepID=A0A6A6VSP8_9PEZI|nr:GPR1/FUN34/YaaH-class plasma membrane protein [Pseudovirgaria hyperparasitica]KAF2753612.1 GPR1/FUN34/YaaH-class plasma membrane protein [Pseudovirgaria hyperparasitica]
MSSTDEKEGNQGQSGMPPLAPTQTAGSITMTPEMFERMYLSPYGAVKGDLRKTFGNPTPLGLAGFLLAYAPIIITFMGWRGAAGNGAATVGTFYFFGGLLAILAAIGEFILGNSFPSTFFAVYGAFFLYYGATLTPWFNAAGAFAEQDMAGMGGLATAGFLSSNAYVGIFMGIFSLYSTICALRTNVLFVLAFALLTIVFPVFSAAQFYGAQGNFEKLHNYTVAAGAVGFPVIIIGLYLLLVLMLSTVDFPVNLPVGDLSTVIKSGTELRRAKEKAKTNNNGAS